MKKRSYGFTLAELLIVVAVIAVLVAVAIPTFNNQLEKSRQATDLSNLRDAYAVAKLAEINGETPAVDSNGDAIKPTKIGAPYELINMSQDAKDDYSGIGYAFVFDPDTAILYPFAAGTLLTATAAPFAAKSATAVTTANLNGKSYTYATIDASTTAGAPVPAYIQSLGTTPVTAALITSTAFYKNILGNDVHSALKARSAEIRVETNNLPGGNQGIVEYGVPAAAAADSKYNGTAKRLWGDTAVDWNAARIVVEFSYDINTSTWTLKRVKNVDTGGNKVVYAATPAVTNETNATIDLAAIRFASLYGAFPTDAKSVCPAFQPVNWTKVVSRDTTAWA